MNCLKPRVATSVREALGAFSAGFHAAAQSHAANVSASILSHIYGNQAAKKAKKKAQQDVMGLSLESVRENLVLRPVVRAFSSWYPKEGYQVPGYFSRHPTAHAVGYPGLFSEEKALIAVMLAVSLTSHFHEVLPRGALRPTLP